MNEIFADTSGWAHFFVRTEPYHSVAKKLMQSWYDNGKKIVTTNYVLIELVALMTSPLNIPRAQQIKTIEIIKNSLWVEIVFIDSTFDEESWALLKTRQDKRWSLVDCAGFIVMQKRGITEAFTSDHHFEQAGFLRMLK